eukprot:3933845-Heterocapsa_arctica.AAC.2
MYHLWILSSSFPLQQEQRVVASLSTSATLTWGQVRPARTFLSVPASPGDFWSSSFNIFLGIVQSTAPESPP